jgi:uncharacterized Rmd1/YagE family protein
MDKVISYQIADSIDIKNFRTAFKADPLYGDADELFYLVGVSNYIYIFKYGVVSFFNYDPVDTSAFLQLILPFCRNPFSESLNDEFLVETGAPENKVRHNKIEIISLDRQLLQLIMLNVSQSVALDYYSELTSRLMEETNYQTQLLEEKGRLSISGNNLKKFIGKTLLLKNKITENLYIFDSPPDTWEDERLDKLNIDLNKNFDLRERFRNISEGLGIVKDNLELFKDILQYRNSVVLEWIIIILISIEVINFFIEKILNYWLHSSLRIQI